MEQQKSVSDRLSSEQSAVRAAALAELLQSGTDASPHMNALASCLNDPLEDLRIPALVLLGRIGAPAADYFQAALDPQQPASIRAVAAAVIAGIGPPAAACVRGLCRCLTSDDENLRNAASIALAKIGEPAVSSLRIMLQFSIPETVAVSVESLAMIGRPAAAAVPELDALAARSPIQLQLACAAAISSLTGDAARGLPILTNALVSPEPLVRKTAAEKIALLGNLAHPSIPNLLRCTADPDEAVRAAAVLTLGRIRAPHDQTLSILISRLSDPAADVRYAAAVVLASYGANARPSLPNLRACLQDPVEKVAKCAAGAVEKIESPPA